MNENLRPSTLGEILDRTAQLYRRNFWLFAGIGALPMGTIIAIAVLGGVLLAAVAVAAKTANLPSAVGTAVLVLITAVLLPIYIAACVFSMGGLTQAAVSMRHGEKLTIRGALKSVTRWFWRYFWFFILQGIYVVLIPAVVAGAVIGVLVYLASRAGSDPSTSVAIGFLVFFVAAAAIGVIIWRTLGYSIGFAVCVAEQETAWQSLQRSWQLSQGTRGRIFVMFLLVIALAIVGLMIAYIPVMIIIGAAAASGNTQYMTVALVVAEIVDIVVNFTVQTLLAPVSWIALVLFYYDQRIRKEGFDIEWMMVQAGLAQLAPAAPLVAGAGISGQVGPPDTVEER
jgi:hypothetical protein